TEAAPPLRSWQGWEFCGRPSLHRHTSPFQSDWLLFVDQHWPTLFISVGAATAPAPFFWRGHQSAPHRILVHVAQLLRAFVPVPHDKIIEAPLPDMALLEHCVPQTSVRTALSLS